MDFKEKYKQYPYGKEEEDRILMLDDNEFSNEFAKEFAKFQRMPWIKEADNVIEEEKNRIEEKKKYFENLRQQYPYGIKENNRVLQLSEEEFEKEFGEEYRRILSTYELYKDEASEFQDYSYQDVIKAEKKYKYFKSLRDSNKDKINEIEESHEK